MDDDLTVFISYRRADSSADAGRLYDALRRRFGRENLFMDVDSLRPGEDWVDAVEAAVTKCDVLLAIIGPTWAGASDSDGAVRINQELDRVRLEIEAALRNSKPVIPVLVEGASMPTAEQLPDSLKPLLRRHAIRISHPTFESDLGALVRALRTIDRARRPKPAGTVQPSAAAAVAATSVPPVTPAAVPPQPPPPPVTPPITPPYGPSQTQAAPAPPVYPVPPAQPAYQYQTPAYGYTAPAPRQGTSPVLLGLLGLGVVLVIGLVLMAVLRIGPFAVTAVSSPTPVPTAVPTSTPTDVPTEAPTVTPTEQLTPTPTLTAEASQTPYPSAAFAPLWAVVPLDVAPSCEPSNNYDTPQLFCYINADQSFWYEAFPDVASLRAKYDVWLDFYDIASGAANCFEGNLPCEQTYAVGGLDPAGHVTGVVDGGDGWMYWTHEPALVMGTGLGTVDASHPFSAMFNYWKDHAGVLQYSATPSP